MRSFDPRVADLPVHGESILRPMRALLLLLLAACAAPDIEYEGTDRQALLPSFRVRGPLQERVVPPEPPGEWFGTVYSEWEVGAQALEGELPHSGGRTDYSTRLYYAAWSPRLDIRHAPVVVEGSLGLAYCDLDFESASFTAREGDFGPYVGMAIRLCALDVLQPYARMAAGGGLDGGIGRSEVGFEVHPSETMGIELAYAVQSSTIAARAGVGVATIDSDGLHLGLVLRF